MIFFAKFLFPLNFYFLNLIKQKIQNQKIFFLDNTSRWSLYVFFFIFIAYGNTLMNKYSFDDEFVIQNSQVTKGIKAIPEIFTSPYYQTDEINFGYRPITKSFFAIEYEIFGKNPFVSHLINILLFAWITLLILKLLRRIIYPATGTIFILIIIVFWIFHPIHTEVVASLKNREELLYLLFCLISLIFFIRFYETGKWWHIVTGSILFTVSFITKQSAISFVLIIPLVLWFLKKEKGILILKNNYKILLVFGILIIISYVLLKIPAWFFPSENVPLLSFENSLHANNTFLAKIAVSAYSMLINLKLLLIPHPLVFYYGQFTIPELNIADGWVIFSILIHIGIFIFIIKNFNRNALLFGILFYFFGIIPFSNYFMPINGIVAERFLFTPSLGFIIAFTFILFKITKSSIQTASFLHLKKSFITIFLIIVACYVAKTINRNTDWKNSFTLFSNDINYLEKSVKANDVLAQNMMDEVMRNISVKKSSNQLKLRLDSIIMLYNRTLALYPENPKALNNLAYIYFNFYKKPDIAINYLLQAYKYKKNNEELTFNIAQCYDKTNLYNDAITFYYKTVALNKKNMNAWKGLININFRHKNEDSVKFICTRLIEIDSTSSIPYKGLGNYYALIKDTAKAVGYWEKAVRLNSSEQELAKFLKKFREKQ